MNAISLPCIKHTQRYKFKNNFSVQIKTKQFHFIVNSYVDAKRLHSNDSGTPIDPFIIKLLVCISANVHTNHLCRPIHYACFGNNNKIEPLQYQLLFTLRFPANVWYVLPKITQKCTIMDISPNAPLHNEWIERSCIIYVEQIYEYSYVLCIK